MSGGTRTGAAIGQWQGEVMVANELLRDGKTEQALQLICRVVESSLSRLNATDKEAVARHGLVRHWPDLGIELRWQDEEPRLICHRQQFSPLEVAAYLRHIVLHAGDDRGYTSDSLSCGAVWPRLVRRLLRGVARLQAMIVACPGHDRVHGPLHWLQWLQQRLQERSPGYRESRQLLAIQVATYLGEPHAHALMLLRECQQYRDRLALLRDPVELHPRVHWASRADYIAFQATDRRSRLVATFHFADYIHAMACFSASTVRQRRRQLIHYQEHEFQQRRDRYADARKQERPVAEMLNSQHLDPLKAVAFLRQPNSNLTVFCDLSRNHGSCVQVNFFGRPAWFVRGPAEIALSARVPLLVLISYAAEGVLHLETPGIIDPAVYSGEDMGQAVRRITQQLVSILEQYVARYPAQWYYLPKIGSYFVNPQGLDAWQL